MVLLNSDELELGTAIPDFNLPDTISGKNYSSKQIDKDVVVVAFICNHCPYVIKILEDFCKLAASKKDQVNFVAISANDPDYREEDSPENMKLLAEEYQFSFPYLFDESQETAKAFAAVCTPDIFVYKNKKLAYHARFEDLENALNDLIKEEKVSFEQLPSAGCSIKWRHAL